MHDGDDVRRVFSPPRLLRKIWSISQRFVLGKPESTRAVDNMKLLSKILQEQTPCCRCEVKRHTMQKGSYPRSRFPPRCMCDVYTYMMYTAFGWVVYITSLSCCTLLNISIHHQRRLTVHSTTSSSECVCGEVMSASPSTGEWAPAEGLKFSCTCPV